MCDAHTPNACAGKSIYISHSCHIEVYELSHIKAMVQIANNGMNSNMYRFVSFPSSANNTIM